MDPKRTRETKEIRESWPLIADGLFDLLADIDIGDETLTALDRTIRGARLWSGLFEECENCEDGWQDCGTGTFDHGCPACGGRGYVLNRERLERAARTVFPTDYNDATEVAVEIVATAIAAFLFGSIDSTETRQEASTSPSHSDPALVVETRQEET